MKKFLLLLLILLIGGGWLYLQKTEGKASGIREDLGSMGLNESYVSASSDEVLIRFTAPAVDNNLMGLAYSVARKAYERTSAKKVRVEAYYLGEPILGLSLENGDFSNPIFEDIRRPEFKIESDLGVFDVVVQSVRLTEDKAGVVLEYLADKEGFWKDYFAMSFVILEDAPWVKEVAITYLADKENLTISVSNGDILRVHSGEMTPGELVESTHITVSGTSSRSCPQTKDEAYRLFVRTYNNVTSLQQAGASNDTLKEAYEKYLMAKKCYESFSETSSTSPSAQGSFGEIHEATLETPDRMTLSFSSGKTPDIMLEPWCVDYPAILGNYTHIGVKKLEDVNPSDIPASGYLKDDSMQIQIGHVYINRNSDGSYTAFVVVGHEKIGECNHRIVLRYKTLS